MYKKIGILILLCIFISIPPINAFEIENNYNQNNQGIEQNNIHNNLQETTTPANDQVDTKLIENNTSKKAVDSIEEEEIEVHGTWYKIAYYSVATVAKTGEVAGIASTVFIALKYFTKVNINGGLIVGLTVAGCIGAILDWMII